MELAHPIMLETPMSRKTSDTDRHFRIIVLGAGFSRPAGLPLAGELFDEVRTRARRQYGESNALERDLNYFTDYKRRCDGTLLLPEDIDYEEFLGFLDVEHALGFRGGDTITSEGNETQLIVKTLIGSIIREKCPHSPAEIPDLYLQFAEQLMPSDWILTFNYDTLLESALAAIDKPFRLSPNRYKTIHPQHGYGELESSQEEVVVLKLHGSVDWFDKAPYDESMAAVGDPDYVPKWYSHFAANNPYGIAPLLEGPQMPDDPMWRIYRMKGVSEYYSRSFVPQPPFILAPSASKMLYFKPLKSLWWGIGEGGGMNLGMVIIGYSLPPHDDHARQAIYRLTDNYTGFEPDLEIGGVRKLPLRMVNRTRGKREAEEFRSRYRFLNWDRTETWLDGFGLESLDFIFGKQT